MVGIMLIDLRALSPSVSVIATEGLHRGAPVNGPSRLVGGCRWPRRDRTVFTRFRAAKFEAK